MNGTILQGLRTKLDKSKGQCTNELPRVLSAYHTTLQTLINETLFNLTFITEAIIPIEIRLSTMQTERFDKATNSNRPRTNLDLLEKTRDQANLKMVAYR